MFGSRLAPLRSLLVGTLAVIAWTSPLRAQGSEEPRLAHPTVGGQRAIRLDVASFKIVDRESGPVNYYQVIEDSEGDFIRSLYKPPYKTAVVATEIPERLRQKTSLIRWKWRALALPKGGNECRPGFADSPAAVYVTFKRGLKWYSLKYVWSAGAAKGQTCDKKRNPFVAQDTIVLETGGPTADWRSVEIDPRAEFRLRFEGGNPSADVPDLVGIGIMSDGDQTQSLSSADYGHFELVASP